MYYPIVRKTRDITWHHHVNIYPRPPLSRYNRPWIIRMRLLLQYIYIYIRASAESIDSARFDQYLPICSQLLTKSSVPPRRPHFLPMTLTRTCKASWQSLELLRRLKGTLVDDKVQIHLLCSSDATSKHASLLTMPRESMVRNESKQYHLIHCHVRDKDECFQAEALSLSRYQRKATWMISPYS